MRNAKQFGKPGLKHVAFIPVAAAITGTAAVLVIGSLAVAAALDWAWFGLAGNGAARAA